MCRLKTKASIKIAALNINRHGAKNIGDSENKWPFIKSMMLRKKIGILIIGEAHMDAAKCAEIERVHGSDLKIFFSSLPNKSNAAGVAVVLNRNLTNVMGIQIHEIVAGHAMSLESNWHNEERISILAVYAPNKDNATNAAFWNKIEIFYEEHPRIMKPNIMLGNLNMVEEPLDRLPARRDASSITEAFDDLKVKLQLVDGWRNTYPDKLEYTYTQKKTGQMDRHSRLDRIYMKSTDMENTFDWKIETPGVKTDHDLVSVNFTCKNAPTIGKGRWMMQPYLMYDKEIKKFLDSEGKHLEKELETLENAELRSPDHNPQSIWARFKADFVKLARQRAKIVVPKLVKEINELEARITLISNDLTLSEDERSISTSLLKE
ncbi:DNase I-like protein, partial [Gymnopus androsaceus JB14]